MARLLRVPAVCLTLGLAFASEHAIAINVAGDISYTTTSGVLSGYARTWKDPWEPDYSDTCYYWEWSDVFGWFCIWWGLSDYYVDAQAQAYTPSSSPFGGAEILALRDAQAAYSFSQPLEEGTWTGTGEHYLVEDYYELFCDSYYGFCYLVYYNEFWYHVGSTSDQTMVPTRILLTISRYTTSSLSEADVDLSILPAATEVLQTNDGAGDVACPLEFRRGGSIAVFAVSDGVISNQAELEAVLTSDSSRVYVVNSFDWCKGPPEPGFTIVGCSAGLGMAVRRWSQLEGQNWAHEYGHNQDYSHNPDPNSLMYEHLVPTARRVTQSQCDVFRNPPN